MVYIKKVTRAVVMCRKSNVGRFLNIVLFILGDRRSYVFFFSLIFKHLSMREIKQQTVCWYAAVINSQREISNQQWGMTAKYLRTYWMVLREYTWTYHHIIYIFSSHMHVRDEPHECMRLGSHDVSLWIKNCVSQLYVSCNTHAWNIKNANWLWEY